MTEHGESLEIAFRSLVSAMRTANTQAAARIASEAVAAGSDDTSNALAQHSQLRTNVHGITSGFFIARTGNPAGFPRWAEIENRPTWVEEAINPATLELDASQITTGTMDITRLPVAEPGQSLADTLLRADDPRLSPMHEMLVTSEGLAAGDFVSTFIDVDSVRKARKADSTLNRPAVGFVAESVGTGDSVAVLYAGVNALVDRGILTSASLDAVVYLAAGGNVALTPPSGADIVQAVGRIIVVGDTTITVLVSFQNLNENAVSGATSASRYRNIALGRSYTTTPAPDWADDPLYRSASGEYGTGGGVLNDNFVGSYQMTASYLGWNNQSPVIIFDIGSSQLFQTVRVWGVSSTTNTIGRPTSIVVEGSDTQTTWHPLGDRTGLVATPSHAHERWMVEIATNHVIAYRYYRISITCGADMWLAVAEVELLTETESGGSSGGSGETSAITVTLPTGLVAIPGLSIVAMLDSGLEVADCRNLNHAQRIVGITTESAGQSSTATVQTNGMVTLTGNPFGSHRGTLFLGYNGAIATQPPYDALFLRVIGATVDDARIILMSSPPVYI